MPGKDSSGHYHKDKGPGGGQFTSNGNAGGGGKAASAHTPSGEADTGHSGGKAPVKASKLTEQQSVEVKDYKEGNYKPLNAYLRNPSAVRPSLAMEYEKQARTIDGAIRKSKLTEDTTVFRGMQHPALAAHAEKVVGRSIDAPTFLSTSMDQGVAEDFAGQSADAVVLKISAKAGTPALDMDQFETSGNANEQELLFGRNQRIRITGVDRSGRVPVVQAEFVRDQ